MTTYFTIHRSTHTTATDYGLRLHPWAYAAVIDPALAGEYHCWIVSEKTGSPQPLNQQSTNGIVISSNFHTEKQQSSQTLSLQPNQTIILKIFTHSLGHFTDLQGVVWVLNQTQNNTQESLGHNNNITQLSYWRSLPQISSPERLSH